MGRRPKYSRGVTVDLSLVNQGVLLNMGMYRNKKKINQKFVFKRNLLEGKKFVVYILVYS